MKISICSKCGKHNLETAWFCANCGDSLSVKTIVELDDESVELHTTVKDVQRQVPVSTETPAVQATPTNKESAVDYAGSIANIFTVYWVIGALRSFAILGLRLDSGSALLWAVIVLALSIFCIGTLVGLILWPFAIGVASNFFSASPTEWNPPASMLSLFITIIVAGSVEFEHFIIRRLKSCSTVHIA